MRPNLRSVVAQLTRAGGGLPTRHKFYLFGGYFINGYCAVALWEIAEIVEYRRVIERDLDERRGLEPKPTTLRDILRWFHVPV